jgi:hypothetical protein
MHTLMVERLSAAQRAGMFTRACNTMQAGGNSWLGPWL